MISQQQYELQIHILFINETLNPLINNMNCPDITKTMDI